MKLTKYEHACFTVEKEGKILAVDPGGFTTDFIAPENVVAVIITHEHGDHLDQEQIAAIADKNPDVVIIGHPSVVSNIQAFETRTVQAGDKVAIGPFALTFRGGQHAVIHSSIPAIANLGVLIDDLLYYPGDSFVLPGASVDVLALPAGAPWMKTAEAMDFLLAVKPRLVFPTHDAVLSDPGKAIADRLLGEIAEHSDIEYIRLADPVEI